MKSRDEPLRIAVTGHRRNRLGWFSARRLPGRVTKLLSNLHPDVGSPAPILMTSLAEGADRIVAQAAWRARWRLHAVLPMPVDAYVEDFQDADSVRIFHSLLERAAFLDVLEAPGEGDRSDSYERAGRFMLERADRLLAVHDGGASRGAGGTHHLMKLARDRGMPVSELKV